jgi:YfiH family protein
MPTYDDSAISIYFGDCSDNIFMSEQSYSDFQNMPNLLAIKPFEQLQQNLSLQGLCFPGQIHSTAGHVIDEHNLSTSKPFSLQGDYLLTNVAGVGLGILTADCLPVLLHDPVHKAIAAIHAGWRGTVAGIVVKALEHMTNVFGTEQKAVRAFFGPSAKQCCYKVGPDLIQAITPHNTPALTVRNNEYYFDLPAYNKMLLEHAGISPSSCYDTFAQCTICNHQYWSYRRQQKEAGRQMTVICLTSP